MQVLPINLTGVQTLNFDIAGAYFEILSATFPVTVNFYDSRGNRAGDLELRNVDTGFYVADRFSRFEITNDSGQPQTIIVFYGARTGGSKKSNGAVQILATPGAQAQKQLVWAAGDTNVEGAAEYQLAGIYANGKAQAVQSIRFRLNTTAYVQLYAGTAAPVGATAMQCVTKNAPQVVASSAQGKRLLHNSATLTAAQLPGLQPLFNVQALANEWIELVHRDAYVIAAGGFLGVFVVAPAVTVQVLFEGTTT